MPAQNTVMNFQGQVIGTMQGDTLLGFDGKILGVRHGNSVIGLNGDFMGKCNSGARSDYDPQGDALMKAAQSLQMIDQIDAMGRRDRQSQMQEVGLQMQATALEIDKNIVQRQQNEANLKDWNKSRAETAASYAAAEVPKINLDDPDGEKQLANWMSYAQAEGVSAESIRFIFESRMREIEIKKELQVREQATTLGIEGLSLFDAFNKLTDTEGRPLMDTESANKLAAQSKQARDALAYYEKLALDNKILFILTADEWAKIKKRVGKGGAGSSVQVPTGNGQTEEFDPRPVYYDLDAVHQIASERLAPELAKRKKLANQEAVAKLRIAESEAIIKQAEAEHLEKHGNVAAIATLNAIANNQSLNEATRQAAREAAAALMKTGNGH